MLQSEKNKLMLSLPYTTLNELYRGNVWFSKDSMRFFRSRICETTYNEYTGFFVSSEQYGNFQRKYTVRRYNKENNTVETVGEFQGYATRAQAITARNNAENSYLSNLAAK